MNTIARIGSVSVALLLLLVLLGATRPAQPAQSAPPATSHQQALRAQLDRRLRQIADRVDGVMGYAILDVTTGERFGSRDQDVFPTASTIKLAILYELFKQVEEKKLALDRPEPVPDAARAGGSGVLGELTSPHLSLRDHAILMILLSDNTATNVLIDRLGLGAIQGRVEGLGLTRTRLRRRMMDTAAARRGDENVSSPAEIVRLLELFQRGDGLAASSRDAALDILTKSKSTPFTRTLPAGTRIASKPGGLEGVQVDAGYVMLKRRPYIAAFMCTYLLDESAGGTAIGEASRAVFDYFDRLGAEGVDGRRIR